MNDQVIVSAHDLASSSLKQAQSPKSQTKRDGDQASRSATELGNSIDSNVNTLWTIWFQ